MKPLLILILFLTLSWQLKGQHDHHKHHEPIKKAPKKETMPKGTHPKGINESITDSVKTTQDTIRSNHAHPIEHETINTDSSVHDHANMYSAFSRNLSMARNGSGTSWHPDHSPMFMNMWHKNKWNLMLHYGMFFNYTNQNISRGSGERGDAQLVLPNWVMFMASRPVGNKGLFTIRSMLSADAIIMGGFGYPLLFQTGETWRNEPLVDRQHPHELISELAVGYSHALNKNADLFTYIAIPGEPSIGPPAFMHRPSAINIPSSPLGHHWQDATHIIFGVATLGFRYRNIKLEGSSFNGSEPDENRFDFDQPKFNSYSFRLSVNPTKSLAFQTSYGYLVSPEVHSPGIDVERYTASILHSLPLGTDNTISSSLVWGMNKVLNPEHSHFSNSFLFESNLLTRRYSFFSRIESIQKSFHELHIHVDNDEKNNLINSFALGASRFLFKGKDIWIDFGIIGTLYLVNNSLHTYYGNKLYSGEIFLRLIPGRMKM